MWDSLDPTTLLALQKYSPSSVRFTEPNERTFVSETIVLFAENHRYLANGKDTDEHLMCKVDVSFRVLDVSLMFKIGLSISTRIKSF